MTLSATGADGSAGAVAPNAAREPRAASPAAPPINDRRVVGMLMVMDIALPV